MNEKWPNRPFLAIAKKHKLLKSVHVNADSTRLLLSLVNNQIVQPDNTPAIKVYAEIDKTGPREVPTKLLNKLKQIIR